MKDYFYKGILKSKQLLNEALEMIFPSNINCIVCNKPIEINETHSICKECYPKIDLISKNEVIVKNYNNKFFIDLKVCANYNEVEKKLISDFKYNNNPHISKNIAEIMYNYLKIDTYKIDCIIAVPLYEKKLKQRGYNQALEICKHLGRLMELKVYKKNLIRKIDTMPQNDLSFLERIINQDGAFEVKNPREIVNKRILLIDDIYTTGSTVDSCAKELMENGAKEVRVGTFAIASFKK